MYTNLTIDNIQNVALVDRIPAGWEIENPRLGRGDRPDWVDEDTLWSADHMNLRMTAWNYSAHYPESGAVRWSMLCVR